MQLTLNVPQRCFFVTGCLIVCPSFNWVLSGTHNLLFARHILTTINIPSHFTLWGIVMPEVTVNSKFCYVVKGFDMVSLNHVTTKVTLPPMFKLLAMP